MCNPIFPSFNFPYTSSEDLRQFLLDYGRTGPVHIFKDGESVECIPQKKENVHSRMVRLISEKPTLPLNIPRKISSSLNMDLKSEFEPTKQNVKELWDYEQPVTNLISDHGDIVFGSLAKVVSKEAAELSWHAPQPLPFFNYYYTQAKTTTKLDPVIKKFENDFCDIPLQLLTALVQETCEQDQVASTGMYYGNCLAYRRTYGEESNVDLVYPEGPTMNELCFRRLEMDCQEETPLSARLSASKGRFSLPERICQISMTNEVDQNSITAVRTEHKCWLFENGSYNSFDKPTFLGNLECKTKACSIAVSPYFPEEVVVAMETGSLWLWNAEDSSVQVVRQCTAFTPEEFEWYFSVFGSHPRQVVQGNKNNIELIDLRGGTSTSQDLMTLPSSHFFPNDKFTSIQHYHGNPFHYFLATTQSLVIMDERFQQQPVLMWSHSLEFPPKYINVLPSPSHQDMLVFAGSYKNHDVHCFQYCYGETSSYRLGMTDDLKGVLPPQSTSMPWKVSSYSEWPEIVEYPNKAQSYPRVNERLSQPLLGLSCISHATQSSTALSVVQLSNTGDLFYQSFIPREVKLTEVRDEGRVFFYKDLDLDWASSGGCGSKKPNLSCKDKESIARWVGSLMDYAIEEGKDMLEGTYSSEDVSLIHENLFSFIKLDVQCNLCSSENLSTVSRSSEERTKTCSCCGLTNKLSGQLSKVRKSKCTVLTKEYLGLNFKPEKLLDMFDEDIQCSEPLGNILLTNWYSDEQVPIDLTERQNTQTEEDQDFIKTWSVGQLPVVKMKQDGTPLKKRSCASSPNHNTAVKEKHVTSGTVEKHTRDLNQKFLSVQSETLPSREQSRDSPKNLKFSSPNPCQDHQVISSQQLKSRNPARTRDSRTSQSRTRQTTHKRSSQAADTSSPATHSETGSPSKKKIAYRVPGF